MIASLLVAALATAKPLSKPDSMCAAVKNFHLATFDAQVQPKGRRWVELHWVGAWMDFAHGWRFACRHSPDQAAARLCTWLQIHVTYEFAQLAPRRILRCYGYVFPDAQSWGAWRSDIDILSHDRWLKLEVNFDSLKGEEGAIRLSSFAQDQDGALVPLPPLAPVTDK